MFTDFSGQVKFNFESWQATTLGNQFNIAILNLSQTGFASQAQNKL